MRRTRPPLNQDSLVLARAVPLVARPRCAWFAPVNFMLLVNNMCFTCAQGDFWSLREEDAAEYERRLTGRFQERNKKRKTLSVAAQHLIPVEKRSRKKYSRKPGKRADVVRLLAQFSASHKETEERAALANGGVVSAELEALFKNPFKVRPRLRASAVCGRATRHKKPPTSFGFLALLWYFIAGLDST